MRRGILVRYFNKPGLNDCIRFSIGTPDQNDVLLAALEEIRGQHWPEQFDPAADDRRPTRTIRRIGRLARSALSPSSSSGRSVGCD